MPWRGSGRRTKRRFASKKQAEAFERGMSAPVLVARFETDPEDAPRGDGIYP